MAVIIRIEIKQLDLLEWEDEFSPEQQDDLNSLIYFFKNRVKKNLEYLINGYYQVNLVFNFNPLTKKFILVKCSNFEHIVLEVLRTDLKDYT
ncbi:hypothetical protein [Winogradskyella vidalii]|uniref:hypothetical protein n=1 Tax=Winogradskyella vidalii TaxID=2615024 RepID=UPI0015CC609B|nr:hypothetical protein [Winogradskyella vidalii]